jgi:MFS family permease
VTTKTIANERAVVGWLLPAGLMLGSFIVLLDATIVSVALPSVGAHLRATTSGLQWVYVAYTLCLSALLLSGGALGRPLWRKRVYLTGATAFTVASLGCALAPDAGTLISFRAVQGCAGALVATGALSLLVQTYQDPKKRAEMIGITGMVAGLAVVLGPVLGGVLVDAVGWRAIFLVNLPVGAVTVWLGAR